MLSFSSCFARFPADFFAADFFPAVFFVADFFFAAGVFFAAGFFFAAAFLAGLFFAAFDRVAMVPEMIAHFARGRSASQHAPVVRQVCGRLGHELHVQGAV